MSAEKIGPQHRARKAVLYVRQSSAHQVQHNRESQATAVRHARPPGAARLVGDRGHRRGPRAARRPAGHARRLRAHGRRGLPRQGRRGGRPGGLALRPQQPRLAAARRDVPRRRYPARRSGGGLRARGMGNDRLLLGLKGSLNEYELDLLRQRSLSARYEKARRGELVVAAPVGFVKVGDRLEKDPDRRVQAAIRLVIDKVAELGSVRQALLVVPRAWARPARRDSTPAPVVWRRPRYCDAPRVHHQSGLWRRLRLRPRPAWRCSYDGAGTQARASGASRARSGWRCSPARTRVTSTGTERRRSAAMVSDNVPTSRHHGAPKHGDALLAGLLRCRRCGRKLTRPLHRDQGTRSRATAAARVARQRRAELHRVRRPQGR